MPSAAPAAPAWSEFMRLAVVSDIHGNLPALQAVCAAIERAGADRVVNLGDVLNGPLWPAETADWLMARGWPTLAGNHERQLLTLPRERLGATDAHTARVLQPRHLAWLAGLPPTLQLAPDITCCHGTPGSDLAYLLETVTPDLGREGSRGIRAATPDELRARLAGVTAPLLLCGHSHQPRALQCGATLVVNPGSVGLPAYDDDHPHPHRVETGSPHARWALVERGEAGWSVQFHLSAYDWEAAARRAEDNGRGDWADALRTGCVGRLEKDVVRA